MHALHNLTPLPTPDEIRRWDEESMRLGLPGFTLMENASRSALHVLRTIYAAPNASPSGSPNGSPPNALRGARVLLFMGGGNNGGDAACLARLLLDEGAHPLLLHIRPLRTSIGAAGQHLRLARACGVPTRLLSDRCRSVTCLPEAWRSPHIIVDGLLGTGFRGQLREDMRSLTAFINILEQRTPAPFVLALDVPSGLDSLSGLAHKDSVRASATVSFAAAKPGLMLPEARPFTGQLYVTSIGIPQRVRDAVPPSYRVLDARCAALLPSPTLASYKNAYGHVLVLGGSPGLTGAPHLAALAALRSGAGLVTAAAPAALSAEVKGGLPDIMALPLASPKNDAAWPTTLPENLVHMLPSMVALVVGPGMGRSDAAAAFLRALLAHEQRPPTVLDADALNLLAEHPDMLSLLKATDILTPHPGEAGRLLQQPAAAVQRARQHALHRLMELAPACWILKGAGTLVGQRKAPVLLSPYDVPTLAVGGSGDVLAGCAVALLASTGNALHAALLAVAAHVRAGFILLEHFPRRGNLASDIAHTLPAALNTLHLLPEICHVDH